MDIDKGTLNKKQTNMNEDIWEKIIVQLLGMIGIVTVAIIGFFQAMKLEREKHQNEIRNDQRYKYYLPFKYSVSEFLDRIRHIEERLSNESKESETKRLDMITRLSQSFEEIESVDWFFDDSISKEGGYFITSTIYLNCILFFRIREIQWKYPYIPLKLNKSLKALLDTNDEQFIRCKESLDKTSDIQVLLKKGNIDIDKFIKKIRTTISKKHGIPYAFHESFGDYISKNEKIINYEEFVNQLYDKNHRKKFEPLINFWKSIISDNENHEIDYKRLNKLRKLIPILELFEYTELRKPAASILYR